MKSGQISLDFMIAALIAVITIGSFLAVVDNFRNDYEKMFVENQLKKIASEIGSFATSTQSMEDTRFTTEMRLPKVQYKGSTMLPEINFYDGRVDVNVIINIASSGGPKSENIGATAFFSLPIGARIDTNQDMYQWVIVTNE
ncbi:MAG: hypothetical protein NTZ73_04260 [Candidatus Diapherotrites archaeon]|nr:hypothetical protein [Candidatus Diapherotrites archaeon]